MSHPTELLTLEQIHSRSGQKLMSGVYSIRVSKPWKATNKKVSTQILIQQLLRHNGVRPLTVFIQTQKYKNIFTTTKDALKQLVTCQLCCIFFSTSVVRSAQQRSPDKHSHPPDVHIRSHIHQDHCTGTPDRAPRPHQHGECRIKRCHTVKGLNEQRFALPHHTRLKCP